MKKGIGNPGFPRAGLIVWSLLLLSGCTSAPVREYVLEGPNADREDNPSEHAARGVIVIGPSSIPEMMDRPQIVIRHGSTRVVMLEQDRWAEPLKDALPRLLAGDLERCFPDERFVTESSAVASAGRARLAIDWSRLDLDADTGVYLVLRWSYFGAETQELPALREAVARISPRSTDVSDMLESLRLAITRVADRVCASLPVNLH